MRLLGCHIDNFGTFHSFDLTFNEGLNVVMQENGWGKTTLAAFVKAMLYGFDSKRVRNVAENERLRYKPWQGGRYGGYLDFEANGQEYRVSRSFGATGSKDSVRIVNITTGKSALDETGPIVGEWLFGLDANAFQKSVYVVQNGFGLSAPTTSLRNRLNALVNEADDVAGFDKAQAMLEERRKHYKRTGNRGAIADVSRDIAKLVEADAKAEAKVSDLRRLDGDLESFDTSIEALDEEIEKAQKAAEREQAAGQRMQALQKVEEQLKGHVQETQEAYEKAVREAGDLPSDKELDEVRQDIADLSRLEEESARAQSSVAAATKQEEPFAAKYPNGLPQNKELQKMRRRVASLRGQETALATSEPAMDKEFERIQRVVAADPALVERSDEVVARADDVQKAVAEGEAASRELQLSLTCWKERRKRLLNLAAEYKERASAVPEGATGKAEELRRAARDLRAASEEVAMFEARREALQTSLLEEQAKLDSLPGSVVSDSLPTAELDAAAADYSDTVAEANEARSKKDDCAIRLREVEEASNKAQARVDEERAAAMQAQPAVPIPAIACFVAAAAAVAAGVAVGPVLFAVGAALAIVGAVLLMKRPHGTAGPSDEAVRAASEAAETLAKVRAAYDEAASVLADREASARSANDHMMSIVGEFFPGESFDSATVAAQVPVLRERLAARPAQAKRVEEAKSSLASVTAECEEARDRADTLMVRYEDVPGTSYAQKAESLERRASDIEALETAALDSRKRLVAAINEETGADVGALDDEGLRTHLSALNEEEPPGADKLRDTECKAKEVSAEYALELNTLLDAFGVACVRGDELAVGAERLSRVVSSYRDGISRLETAKRQSFSKAQQIAKERKPIDTWASRMGADGFDSLTDEWFDSVAADISALEKAAWERRRAESELRALQKDISDRKARTSAFFAKHGIQVGDNLSDGLDTLVKRVNEVSDLARAAKQAQEELKRWTSENGDELESEKARVAARAQNGSSARLSMLRDQRDTLVKERARLEEQRTSTLDSLENRLAVRQELELLSKRKQVATANLFTIQKTSEYLRSAREGLDGRYLGDLADRFGDYANSWLEDDEIEAVVGPDFDVALFEGGSSHDVAGYSTGYRDLLDLCFRMALIDTVFQAESPFLIMDDPFTSLDAAKMSGAFLLLQSLAEKYQIIYFTCHPSRTEEQAVVSGQNVFVLPEQRERRELPRARARREAEERAKAQAELVASYHVVPVTRGRAAIAPMGKRHSISSNLLSVKFVVDDADGSGDNSFEVHFIDDKGRVLCDRQTVEVIGGHIVPDKVRFSLVTRDDSGDTYDMIIHEDGREPTELAGRIPYKAEVSFATDDFGF